MKEKQYFEIEQSELTFGLLSEQKPEIVQGGVGILILPSSPQHEAFYSGTIELFEYMRENSSDGTVEIFSTDEEYKELAQHSADFWIGTFFVGSIFVPLLVNLLSSYIFEKLKAKDGDTLSVNVIVEKSKGKSVSINFRGDAKDFPAVIESIRKLSDE